MLIECLFNGLGEAGTFGLGLTLFALPLALLGALLRRQARSALLRWDLIEGARRPLRDLGAGRVATEGTLRRLAGGRAVIEDGEARAVLDPGPLSPALSDGQRVLVAGFATRLEDDPRGAHYRSAGRVWLIEGAGEELLVTGDTARPARSRRRARGRARLGLALVGLAVAFAVGLGALSLRATWADSCADSWTDEFVERP